MEGVLITDICPGARFQQPGSIAILIIDKIEDGTATVYDLIGEQKMPTRTIDCYSLCQVLNMAGYEKI
jgi:hypothetical protein